MTKNEENNLKSCLEKIEPAYNKFRHFVGMKAIEHGLNPFAVMVSILKASLQQEEKWFDEAKEKVEKAQKRSAGDDSRAIALKIAGVLGIKLEDVKNIEIGPKELKKIVDGLDIDDLTAVMKAIEESDDDDEDDVLDF